MNWRVFVARSGRIWRYFGGTTNIGSGRARDAVASDITPDFLSGCALLGPRGFFEETGGFATEYFAYYHRCRVHRSLDMDCPDHRPVQPADSGVVVEIPQVGGIHRRYERRAA